MIIAFQIILLIIILISFVCVAGERDDEALRSNMTAVCIASITAFIVSVMWL